MRYKSAEQITAELQAILDAGGEHIFLGDDNFIGTPKKALEILDTIIAFQKKNNYPFAFGTERTAWKLTDMIAPVLMLAQTLLAGSASPSAKRANVQRRSERRLR